MSNVKILVIIKKIESTKIISFDKFYFNKIKDGDLNDLIF